MKNDGAVPSYSLPTRTICPVEGLQNGLFIAPTSCVIWHSFGSFVAFNGLLNSLVAAATAGTVELEIWVPFEAGVAVVAVGAGAFLAVSGAVAAVAAGAVAAEIADTADGASRVTPEAAAIAAEAAIAPVYFPLAVKDDSQKRSAFCG